MREKILSYSDIWWRDDYLGAYFSPLHQYCHDFALARKKTCQGLELISGMNLTEMRLFLQLSLWVCNK